MAGNMKYKSGVTDGATAIGHELDTYSSLVTDGSKLLSVKNAGVEKFSIDRSGHVNTSNLRVVQPSEGAAGISAALGAVHLAGGGVVQLLAGEYIIDAYVASGYYTNNVVLQGMGDTTILKIQSGGGFGSPYALMHGYGGMYLGGTPIAAPSKGDTSLFLSSGTEYLASYLLAGDRVRVLGYIPGHPADVSFLESECHRMLTNGIYIPAVQATGNITLDSDMTGADLVDGETFTLDDGVNTATIFEFDSGGGVSGGNIAVPFTVGDDAATLKASIISAINGVLTELAITASDGGTYIVSLINDAYGTMGNIAIADTVSSSKFTHTGMSGGVDASGEIQLDTPIQRTIGTGAAVYIERGGENNALRDMKIVYDSGTVLAGVLYMDSGYNNLIENVTFEGFTGLPVCGPMCYVTNNVSLSVLNCRFKNLDASSIFISGQFNVVRDCVFDNVNKVDNYYDAAIRCWDWDFLVENNVFRNVTASGVAAGGGSGTVGVRRTFLKNEFYDIKYTPIVINSSHSCRVEHNLFDGCTGGAFVNFIGSYDCIVRGNIFKNGIQGVVCQGPNDSGHIVSNNVFRDMTTYECVSLQDGKNMTVTGNVFINVNDALYLNISESAISSNVVDGYRYGVQLTKGNNVISNNVFRNTTGQALYVTGNDNIFIGNHYADQPITDTGTGNDFVANKE